jgi:hypothetical protein
MWRYDSLGERQIFLQRVKFTVIRSRVVPRWVPDDSTLRVTC